MTSHKVHVDVGSDEWVRMLCGATAHSLPALPVDSFCSCRKIREAYEAGFGLGEAKAGVLARAGGITAALELLDEMSTAPGLGAFWRDRAAAAIDGLVDRPRCPEPGCEHRTKPLPGLDGFSVCARGHVRRRTDPVASPSASLSSESPTSCEPDSSSEA